VKYISRFTCLALAALLLSPLATLHATGLAKLRCEYLANPHGIDATQRRLSWVIESAQRGERQTAYQV
jgi:alpha-L-rhamnosidase